MLFFQNQVYEPSQSGHQSEGDAAANKLNSREGGASSKSGSNGDRNSNANRVRHDENGDLLDDDDDNDDDEDNYEDESRGLDGRNTSSENEKVSNSLKNNKIPIPNQTATTTNKAPLDSD